MAQHDRRYRPIQRVLQAALIGALFGLAEAIVLHHGSAAPYRDRTFFLVATALYAAAGGAVGLLLLLAGRMVRALPGLRGELRIGLWTVIFFLLLEAGVTAVDLGWYRTAPIRTLAPGRPRLACGLALLIALPGLYGILRLTVGLGGRIRISQALWPARRIGTALAAVVAIAGTASAVTDSRGPEPGLEEKPNVLILLMDTVRADAVNPTNTPQIYKVSEDGRRFSRATAVSAWTLPSHASLLTGQYLTQHGASNRYVSLRREAYTLAEMLKDEGYNTAAFSNNPFFFRPERGFAQGFDQFYTLYDRIAYDPHAVAPTPDRPQLRLAWLWPAPQAEALTDLGPYAFRDEGARRTVNLISRWLSGYRSKRPWFIFVNLNEAHSPYTPVTGQASPPLPTGSGRNAEVIWRDLTQPRPVPKDIAWSERVSAAFGAYQRGEVTTGDRFTALIRERYDAEVRYMDTELGRLFDFLKKTQRLDKTALFITSDHGEQFGEQGLWQHSQSTRYRLLHVPLIVRYPKQFPAGLPERTDRVQLIDIFSTIEAWVDGDATDRAAKRPDAVRRLGQSLEIKREPLTVVIAHHRFMTEPTMLGMVELLKVDAHKLPPSATAPLESDIPFWEQDDLTFFRVIRRIDLQDASEPAGREELERAADWLRRNRPLIPPQPRTAPHLVLLRDRWLYRWKPLAGEALFDLSRDPDERINLAFDPAFAEELLRFRTERLKQAERLAPLGLDQLLHQEEPR